MGVLLTACANDNATQGTIPLSATYTTSDGTRGGCLDSPNGVNCNHYASEGDVYVNGGPAHAQLADGSYYFAVLEPGAQHGGFVDGARGNLSDTVAGGSAGDLGSGDAVENRTFVVSGGTIAYTGTHALGTSPTGHVSIQVAPFDATTNPGGVYILAVCQTGATSPSKCRFDAFHVAAGASDEDGGTKADAAGSGDDGGGTTVDAVETVVDSGYAGYTPP